jgi:hypothetical protein
VAGRKANDIGANINSFGEDENGEIYVLAQKTTGTFLTSGTVYQVQSAP